MKMETIFFVALTPGMVQMAEQVARELNVSFPIEIVSFADGPNVARANPQADAFVSIGNGRWGGLCRGRSDHPCEAVEHIGGYSRDFGETQ